MSLRELTFAVFTGLGFALLAGCGSQSSLDAGAACGKTSDCPSGQTCRMPKAPGQKPQVVYNPCMMLAACTTTSQCSSGMVCGTYVGVMSGVGTCPSKVCQAPCQTGSCPADQVCGADGVCDFRPCDEAGAPACSEHYRCDPAAAPPVDTALLTPAGSSVIDSVDPRRETARGCVRKLCDEDGGFVCRDTWTCDPPNAMQEPSGCTPDPCAASGQCESDYYVCKPTSDGPRPAGMDVHGCVARNCEEGAQCTYMPDGVTNYSHCNVGAARADTYGCVITQCDELPGCNMGYLCDPGSQGSDPRGCRYGRCDESGANACTDGYVCDPTSTLAGSNGCRSVPVANGGTGGGGTGGAGVGGSLLGGSGGGGALGGSAGTSARGGSGGTGATSGSSNGGSGAIGGSGAVGSGGTAGNGGSAGGEMTGMCVADG